MRLHDGHEPFQAEIGKAFDSTGVFTAIISLECHLHRSRWYGSVLVRLESNRNYLASSAISFQLQSLSQVTRLRTGDRPQQCLPFALFCVYSAFLF